MARSIIIKHLKEMRPDDFVSHYLFDCIPYVFSERRDFISWKESISKIIEVDPANITIVGSAAYGVSLNPNKSLKNFDNKSDIDVAVISSFHFNTAWRYMRNNKNQRYRLKKIQRDAWDNHEKGLIYYGAIATDKIISLMPFAAPWMRAATEAAKAPSISDREVLFRIYNDYDSLRSYQVRSVKAAQPLALAL